MDFRLTEEQRLLKDTLNRLIAELYPFGCRPEFGWNSLRRVSG